MPQSYLREGEIKKDAEKMLLTLKTFTAIPGSDTFLRRYRRDERSFNRQRKIPFSVVLTLLLRKSVKSLQRVLNEWCRDTDELISASALSQARQKFRYTAFIELLEECVIKPLCKTVPSADSLR